jgi:hypothetical protein
MFEEIKFRKIKIFAYVFLAFVFVAGIVLYNNLNNNGKISAGLSEALLEKNNYSVTDELKVEIKNKEDKRMCFSSCYPYVMQTKNVNWDIYSYPQCDKENIAETCIEPGQLKAFAILLNAMPLRSAVHRLAIPACLGCAIGDQFRVDKIIYTDEFEIK